MHPPHPSEFVDASHLPQGGEGASTVTVCTATKDETRAFAPTTRQQRCQSHAGALRPRSATARESHARASSISCVCLVSASYTLICNIGNRRLRSCAPLWAPSLVLNSVLIRSEEH